jgi:hypothetical protein
MGLKMTNTTLEAEDEEEAIQTIVTYLMRDPKHETEKPYDFVYDNGGVIPQTNMSLEYKPILVHDFRSIQSSNSFNDYGFTSAKIDCPLTAMDFDHEKSITEAYYPVIEDLLRQKFPDAAMVKIMEHNVRILLRCGCDLQ